MTVGDQIGRIVGAPAGLDRDAPERGDRRGRRSLVLHADAGAEPHRLRARQLPVRALPLPGAARPRGRRLRGRRRDRRGDRRADAPRSDQPRALQVGRDPGRRADRQPRPRRRRPRDPRRLPVGGNRPSRRHRLDVDFAVGGSVKWLCGGPGNGWLYVRPDLAERLEPAYTGWQAHEAPFAFEEEMRYAPGAARFLTGTPNVPALYAATPGYDLIEEIGVERIRENSLRQTELLIRLAEAAGFGIASPRDPARRGGTVTVHVDEFPAVHKELSERQILCDFRPGAGIRIGPHYYTSDAELEHVVAQITRDRRDRRLRAPHRRRRQTLGPAVHVRTQSRARLGARGVARLGSLRESRLAGPHGPGDEQVRRTRAYGRRLLQHLPNLRNNEPREPRTRCPRRRRCVRQPQLRKTLAAELLDHGCDDLV